MAAGTASVGQDPHRTAAALAELLGTSVVDFPGGHGGFREHPEDFGRKLTQVLGDLTA